MSVFLGSPAIQVPLSNSLELVLSPVNVQDPGFYTSQVNSSFAFSQWAHLDVCDLQGISHSE